MVAAAARRWALTLVRGLLCVWLALSFAIPALQLDERPPSSTHDEVGDDGEGSLTTWLGRGGTRIVKRLVGTDHWAINAVVPDELRCEACPRDWVPVTVSSRPRAVERRVAPARGPPRTFTI
jgi:hypothetical protein